MLLNLALVTIIGYWPGSDGSALLFLLLKVVVGGEPKAHTESTNNWEVTEQGLRSPSLYEEFVTPSWFNSGIG